MVILQPDCRAEGNRFLTWSHWFLRDPEIMGKDTFGKDRLLKVVKGVGEYIDLYQKAWEKDDETDYYRAKLDAALAEAYGESLHDSFMQRYEYCCDYDYVKGRWKK